MAKLNLRKQKFCLEWLKCGNATKAAIIAGYSAKTANRIGSRLLTKVDIKEYINKLKENVADAIGVNPIRIAEEYAKIAFSNVADSRTSWITLKDFNKLTEAEKAAIAEIQYETKKVGKKTEKMVKIKYHNKLSALDSLTKMLGYNAPEKHELTGKDGKPLQQEVRHIVEFSDYDEAN